MASASFLWEASSTVKDWISTGSLLLDLAISNVKNGGIPVGRLTEISGGEGCVAEDTLVEIELED